MINIYERKSPKYIHDCKNCRFFKGYDWEEYSTIKQLGSVDIYIQCKANCSPEKTEYLFRWSSEGHEYTSGLDLNAIFRLAAEKLMNI
jgi:hypothetical protein